MKHVVAIILSCLLSSIVVAQPRQDQFSSYESMVGEKIILYNAYSSYLSDGPYAYENKDGKYKVIKDSELYQHLDGTPISVMGIVPVRKKQYLHIDLNDSSLFLLLDKKHDYISNASSISYWEKEFQKISNRYSHISYTSPLINHSVDSSILVLQKYLPISWSSVHYPKQLKGLYTIECKVRDKVFYWSLDELSENVSSFLSNEDYEKEIAIERARYLAEKKEKERLDSIADISTLCEAKILHTIEARAILERNDIDNYHEDETIYLSVYACRFKDVGVGKNKRSVLHFDGYALGKDLCFPITALEFTNNEAESFIESRGESGADRRKVIAKANDDIRTGEYMQHLIEHTEWIHERLTALTKFRQQKKILILSQEYSYSSYQFGLKFEFYNCYQKDIKYINLTITAYNGVGDVQRDDIGRSKKEVRCIGPLEKGEIGTYDFNDLFWDENGIIHQLVVTNLKVTFMDNSVISYSGKKNVELHTSGHFAEQQYKILHEGEKR